MQLVQCEIFKKIVIYLFIKKNCSKTSKNSIFFLIKLIPYLRHYFCKTEKEIKLYSVPDLEYPILGVGFTYSGGSDYFLYNITQLIYYILINNKSEIT